MLVAELKHLRKVSVGTATNTAEVSPLAVPSKRRAPEDSALVSTPTQPVLEVPASVPALCHLKPESSSSEYLEAKQCKPISEFSTKLTTTYHSEQENSAAPQIPTKENSTAFCMLIAHF